MTITVWQHIDFEGPSAIEDWAGARGFDLEIVRADYDEPFGAKDALVVLGGPMSIYDDVSFLSAEKSALKNFINKGGKVFGICLGAQLVAEALGAKVYPSGTRETGWRSVEFIKDSFTQDLGESATVFHWHGDTFDLPPGATLLASNDAFKNQMFSAKNSKIIAAQFHFETTFESMNDLIEADQEYLNYTSPFMQTEEEILKGAINIPKANELLFKLLDKWISL